MVGDSREDKTVARLFSVNTDSTPLSVARLRQFRPIEVATLEKRERHFKKPGLVRLEFELLPTLRHWADCSNLSLVLSNLSLLSNHNPSPTFRTRDAGARNAISHSKIILCVEKSAVDGIWIGCKIPTLIG
jgi:hypothetical protein